VCWAVSARRGVLQPQRGFRPAVLAVAMAVARPPDGGPVHLFGCEWNWGAWDAFLCESVEDARRLAATLTGESLNWQEA
jgi:hypothetical protein